MNQTNPNINLIPRNKSWYVDHPEQILHPSIRCFEDALTESIAGTVWIVYFRVIKKLDSGGEIYYELETLRRAKVGKGYFEGGSETRDASAGGSDGILETWAAVACVNEEAAYALEELLHKNLKSQGRWVERIANNQDKKSGEEWFDGWAGNKQKAIDEFNQLVSNVTQGNNIGRKKFTPRYYQKDGGYLISDFLDTNNELKDFYLLFKPRAGKNTTSLLGLSLHTKNCNKTVVADFVSQWPSAFSGLTNDIGEYIFVDDITIGYVDTSITGWEDKQQELLQNCNILIRLASMQSINQAFSQECDDDEEYEGPIEFYNSSKVALMKQVPASICILDESDHGMRTEKSQDFLEEFGYEKRIWMSGTDLYALKHKVRIGNHAVYDIIQERIDIDNNIFNPEVRSKMRMHKCSIDNLPFPDLSGETLDAKELSRRQRNLCETTQSPGKPPRKSGNDGLFRDATGKVIEFKNQAEVISAFNQYYNWINFVGIPSPSDHDHVFWTMPTVSSCKALYNLIRQGKVVCQHHPLLANNYGSAFTIEEEVNADMKRHSRTIFITVGRMLRGAKAPWSAVVRWDDYSDFKVGLQLMLRGQNTNKEWFDVYDCNPFRVSLMRYEIVRSRTNGKKIDSEGKKYFNFVPIYRLANMDTIEESWEETVEDYQTCGVREGYRKESLLDESGVVDAINWLSNVDRSKESNTTERDPNAGKEGRLPKKKPSKRGNQTPDPLAEQKQRALTISSMLPLLVFLSEGEYTEIDELINNTNDEIFNDWLSHCGVITDLDISESRKKTINLFEAEEINKQIGITCQRLKSDGLDNINWSEFNREKEGDVSTPRTAVDSLLSELPISFWVLGPRCLDPSCGTGEWAVSIANRLKEQGFDPKELLYYADTSPINLHITSIRLGFNNGFCYNITNKGKDLRTIFMTKYHKKFDLFATNPPFQKADKSGRDNDNLWPKFLELGHHITESDGYKVMVTPGSWASLGTNDQNPGSKDRKKYFDTKKVDVVDFTIGEHFDVGSTFTGYVIQQTKASANHKTKLVFKDNVVEGKFSDYPCFSLWYSNSEFIDIVKQFRTSKHYDIIMEDPYHTARAAMPKKLSDGIYHTQKSSNHPYRAYHTNAQTHLYSSFKNSFHNQWKVVFSYSGSWKAEVTNDCSLTDASMCILCDTEQQALSVQSVLQSEPVKFLIDKVFRWGGYYNGLFIRWIPALATDKVYTTEEVYQALFTTQQANLIKSLLKEEADKKQAKKDAKSKKPIKPKKIKANGSKQDTITPV